MPLLIIGCGFAPAVNAQGNAVCKIEAWSTDEDPSGLNIRAGSGIDSPVIAKIPPPQEIEGETYASEVWITGAKDGWFRIVNAEMTTYGWYDAYEIVFEGEGWVSGQHLGLLLNHSYLYGGPSMRTPVIAELRGEDAEGIANGPDSFVVDRLHSCAGRWVEVEGTFLGKHYRGWTTDTCSNQVTTCP